MITSKRPSLINPVHQHPEHIRIALSALAGIYRRRFDRKDTALRKHPYLRVPDDKTLNDAAERIYKVLSKLIWASFSEVPLPKKLSLDIQLATKPSEKEVAEKELRQLLQDWLVANSKKGIENAKLQERFADVKVNWDFVNEDAQTFLKDYAIKLADHLTAQAEFELRATISDGLQKGEGAKGIEAMIKEQVDETYVGRAETIARTEGMRALNQGRLRAYDEMGFDEVVWIASDLACEECKDLDNNIFKIDELPPLPAHPRCRCTMAAVSDMTPRKGDKVIVDWETLPEGFSF